MLRRILSCLGAGSDDAADDYCMRVLGIEALGLIRVRMIDSTRKEVKGKVLGDSFLKLTSKRLLDVYHLSRTRLHESATSTPSPLEPFP